MWPRSGKAEVWASGQDLQPTAPGGFGVNGLKVHDGSGWVSNSSQGTLLRIPMLPDSAAGPTVEAATGLASIDDFSFTGHGNTLLVAQPGLNQVDLITPGGASRAVLTAASGLSGPSSVSVSGRTVYVTSAAYATGVDPNLLMARLGG